MAEKVLELEDLAVSFDTPEGEVEAVRGVNLHVDAGEILCIVGESGCGKTVMCRSVMHLLPPIARIRRGRMTVCGEDITHYTEKQMRNLRGNVMSMVFQDPLETLNPTVPVGRQIMEVILKHQKVSKAEAKARALELLQLVGIEQAADRFALQPHFFSGGMRQRCVIAAALAANAKLLFADEATTALDVTVKAKILDLLLELREKTGVAIVFVTHDLGSVAGSQIGLLLCMPGRWWRPVRRRMFFMIPGIRIRGACCLPCRLWRWKMVCSGIFPEHRRLC